MRVQSVHMTHKLATFSRALSAAWKKDFHFVDIVDHIVLGCPHDPQSTRPPAKREKQRAKGIVSRVHCGQVHMTHKLSG